MTEVLERLKALRTNLERKKGQRDQLQRSVHELEQAITIGKRQAVRHERALEIVRQVGLMTQKQLEYHLSQQVSLAMAAVFDDPYQLKVNFVERRGKTEVELLFTRGDMEMPPLGAAGGGTIDVASFALRVAYLCMRRDKAVRPVLVLDEPFSQLKGEQCNRRALAMVREISRRLGVQIIMVSDERVDREDIIANADRVFHVSRGPSGSRATQL